MLKRECRGQCDSLPLAMVRVTLLRDGKPVGDPAGPDQIGELLRDEHAFAWIDASDPGEDDIEALQEALGLHPVATEDVRHRGQRSKVELYDDHVFVVLRPLAVEDDGSLEAEEEIHAFGGKDYLATLRFGNGFDMGDVVARWGRQSQLFEYGGFALYVLIDEVVDGYLEAMEKLEDEADRLEDEVFEDRVEGDAQLLERIFRLKRSVIRMRRLIVPLRHGIDLLQEDERVAPHELAPYYRDVMDHVLRCVELADNVRDVLTSLLELRSSQIANKTNIITKRISAWAGIILLPTLIAGIYGMNFRHMPELHWLLGYPLALGSMVVGGAILHRGFKKRDWL